MVYAYVYVSMANVQAAAGIGNLNGSPAVPLHKSANRHC